MASTRGATQTNFAELLNRHLAPSPALDSDPLWNLPAPTADVPGWSNEEASDSEGDHTSCSLSSVDSEEQDGKDEVRPQEVQPPSEVQPSAGNLEKQDGEVEVRPQGVQPLDGEEEIRPQEVQPPRWSAKQWQDWEDATSDVEDDGSGFVQLQWKHVLEFEEGVLMQLGMSEEAEVTILG